MMTNRLRMRDTARGARRRSTGAGCVLLLCVLCAASRAGSFVLIDETGLGHGPYALARGGTVLGGAFTVEARGDSGTFRATVDGRNWGTFFLTNQAALTLGGQAYEVLLTTPDFHDALAAGADTRHMEQVLAEAVTNDEARAGIEIIAAAKAAHARFRNTRAVEAALGSLGQRAAEEEAMKAAGKVKVEGRWMESGAAAKRLQELEAARMQAQGFVMEDGTWMSPEAAREHRLEKAREAARKAAEERRQFEQNKCRRCNGTGCIYFEIRPSQAAAGARGGTRPPDLRIEKPGLPPKDSKYAIERDACPACDGTGRRK